jgi:hypothetical protein
MKPDNYKSIFNLIKSSTAALLLISIDAETTKAEEIDANVFPGDIFPVEVIDVAKGADKEIEKVIEVEFWAINIWPNEKEGELLVISQKYVPGQRYPLYKRCKLENITELTKNEYFGTAILDPVSRNTRKLIIKMKGSMIFSVRGTLDGKSIMSGTSIERRFRNLTDKNYVIYVDKPSN